MLIPPAELVGPPNPERRYRLLEEVRRRGRERRFSERTIAAYVHWIRRFVSHFGRRHPRELGVEHVREFLSFLTTEQRVAASTHNQALAALTFLYVAVLRHSIECRRWYRPSGHGECRRCFPRRKSPACSSIWMESRDWRCC